MRLSRVSFFADFYIYPTLAVALVAIAFAVAPDQWLASCLAVLIGAMVWTLVEYLLHRFMLHRVPWIREQHAAHHNSHQDLIGTPTWLSLGLTLVTVLFPAILITNLALGSGFTAGFMLGYLWYVAVHYAVHHRTAQTGSYFSRLQRRHAVHHHYDVMGNFGVSSGLWDYVFLTNVTVRGKSSRA